MAAEQKLFFEDFSVGEEHEFGRYEVTRDEVIEFASKYDPQPFHLDDEAGKASIFGGLCASGWHTCAMTMRMMVDHMENIGTKSRGSPGLDEVRWRRPVYPGDVLRVRSTIIEIRPLPKRPGIGAVKTSYTVLNQDDKPVMTFVGDGFFSTRGKA